ncbi:TPA: restriction endonuclease [Escherichia coli]|nr:restriction endonuclease subunit S [Escherichia coli]MCV1688072.1 restriction endonuclease subunit S [Escherichia coli]HAV8301264.1 restriction endonuclease [Escherichia coli]HAY0139069.1 restriction endonuclease [Escherichia coli]HAY0251964.1 restriction endonuclease [Escherichia coli]
MNWPMGKVTDIAEIISGFAFKSEWFGAGDAKVIRIGDLKNGRINLSEAMVFDEKVHKVREQYRVKSGDILMALSGATVGKIAVADLEAEGAYLNQRVAVIRGKCYENTEFLKYIFTGSRLQKLLLNAGGAAQPNLSPKDLAEMEIPLPPLTEQKRIAAILDKADAIRQKREQAIKLADDFLCATFLDMFGDPVENPKGWNVFSLLEYGSFKNGMNFTKGESGTALKCLGVGDFKSLATITCVDNIAEIELNTPPSAEYLLKDGDIVFVRSNGNKALIGRCLTIYPGKEKVTFSGFCIRYRIESTSVTPEYLNFLFRTPSVKQKMLSGGQGANIQNISQGTLSSLRIPIPPLEKQQAFSKVVSFHSELMEKMDINLVKINDMFDSISQNYFN